ncbi:SDR family oxidoreductase [Cryomorphaceae bacterium 1068]|nr:SDR family oxidoreductase [Cryomorphaceae bacterium 1068]
MTYKNQNTKKIVLAGATGYLGQHLVEKLKERSLPFSAIARNPGKLYDLGLSPHEIITAQVTEPLSLMGQLEGAHTVISTVGITRQKDGLTYMDVDYAANVNLLREAVKAGVKKFVYVSVLNGQFHRDLKILRAKEKFVDALKASGIEYIIIRPNGFFSDMGDFLEMAKGGRVYLFGDGNRKVNPIHGSDLANVIIDELYQSNTEIEVGGPDILTHNEIAELALTLFAKRKRVTHFPNWLRNAVIWLLRKLSSEKFYGPYEFFLTMMSDDQVAPRYGVRRLRAHFIEEADRIMKS